MAAPPPSDSTDPTLNAARAALDRHGYPFQYAVIRRAQELFERRESRWIYSVAEFPVGGARETRADFILRSRDDRLFLVAECKRADPALSTWCFVSAPYTWRNADANDNLVFQEVPYQYGGLQSPTVMRRAALDVCHIGFELRSGERGDGTGTNRTAIEDAAAQVLRGLNGVIDGIFGSWAPSGGSERQRTVFVPAIFTTAHLYRVRGDIAGADLRTGRLPADWGAAERVRWLWFNYNQSPSFRHHLTPAPSGFDLAQAIIAEFTRSIAIVGPDGIDEFLSQNLFGQLPRDER